MGEKNKATVKALIIEWPCSLVKSTVNLRTKVTSYGVVLHSFQQQTAHSETLTVNKPN